MSTDDDPLMSSGRSFHSIGVTAAKALLPKVIAAWSANVGVIQVIFMCHVVYGPVTPVLMFHGGFVLWMNLIEAEGLGSNGRITYKHMSLNIYPVQSF